MSITVTIGGKAYAIAATDEKILSAWLDWADSYLPHPLDEIKDKLSAYPPEVQTILIHDAMRAKRCRKSIEAPEMKALLGTPEGAFKILALRFQRADPSLSDETVAALYDACKAEHGENYLAALLADELKQRQDTVIKA